MLRYGDMSKDKYVQRRYRIAKEMLKDVVFPKAKVLDIGCYDGYFLSLFPGIDAYGMDTDLEALEVAKSRGIKTSAYLDFLSKKYNIVICMEVLEHLKEPENMLKSIKSILRYGGTALISIPNECNLWTRIRMLLGWGINDLPFDPDYHLHFPTLKQSEKFISKYFTITKKRYWVYGLPSWFALLPGLFARGVIYECH